MKRFLFSFLAALLLVSTLAITASAQVVRMTTSSCILSSSTNTLQGSLGGANYTIQVPAN